MHYKVIIIIIVTQEVTDSVFGWQLRIHVVCVCACTCVRGCVHARLAHCYSYTRTLVDVYVMS